MITIGVHEAKTQLSKLLERVATGEEIIISKSGKPVARLGPLAKQKGICNVGIDQGLFEVPANFDEELPGRVLAEFEA